MAWSKNIVALVLYLKVAAGHCEATEKGRTEKRETERWE